MRTVPSRRRGWPRLSRFLPKPLAELPFDRASWGLASGIRAAIAVGLPVGAGTWLGVQPMSWFAIATFWCCLTDTGGAWRNRLHAMASFVAAGTIGVALALLSAPTFWLSIAFAGCFAFGAAFVRVFGDAASTVGVMAMTAVLVAIGIPAMDETDLVVRPLLTLGGCLWAMLMALGIWRIHLYAPARRAVSHCWSQLAEYAEAIGHAQLVDSAQRQSMFRHRHAIRAAMEAASNEIAAIRQFRSGSSDRERQLVTLVANADQIFERLIALAEFVAPTDRPSTQRGRALRVVMTRMARELRHIGRSISQTSRHRQEARVLRPYIRPERLRNLSAEARRQIADIAGRLAQVSALASDIEQSSLRSPPSHREKSIIGSIFTMSFKRFGPISDFSR